MDTGHDHDSVTSSDRIDKLVDLVQKLLEKMTTMDDKLHEKCELIEARVKKVEERVTEGEKDLELRLAEIDENVSQYVGKLDTDVEQKLAEMDKHVSKCMDAQAVQEVLSIDKSEENEIERRKTNVIVHGVPESDADDADWRTDDDMTVLAAMFHEVEADDIKVGSVVRLGKTKKASDPKQNPRPMKVVLDSVENKVNLLRKAKSLREKEEGGWSKIFIHQDLTPKQREARKPLVAELKPRKANGETDLTIYRGAVVKKKGH